MAENEQRLKTEFGKSGRDFSVDILRCFSCWMVITGHAVNMIARAQNNAPEVIIGSMTWDMLAIIKAVVISATTIFIMVSGIFFLSPNRTVTPKRIWKKNILKLVCAYIVWCWIYAIFYGIYNGESLSLYKVLYGGLLNQPIHLWYIPMLVALYVIAPFLRLITKQADKELYKYGLIIFFAAFTLNTVLYFPELTDFQTIKYFLSKTPTQEVATYAAIYIFGYYLYTFRPDDRTRRMIYVFGIIAIIISSWFTIYAAADTNHFAVWGRHFYGKLTITSVIKNAAIFLFIVTVFQNVKLKGIGRVFLTKLSNATLIIYLIHIIFLKITFNSGLFYPFGLNPAIGVVIHSTIVFLMGFVVAFAFQSVPWKKIKDKLFLRRRAAL